MRADLGQDGVSSSVDLLCEGSRGHEDLPVLLVALSIALTPRSILRSHWRGHYLPASPVDDECYYVDEVGDDGKCEGHQGQYGAVGRVDAVGEGGHVPQCVDDHGGHEQSARSAGKVESNAEGGGLKALVEDGVDG